VVFDGVFIKERCGAVWRTPPFGKIYGFQVGTGILNAANIVFRRAASYGLCELFPICRVGHGDDIGTFGEGLGQVEVVEGKGEAFVVVYRHVAVEVVLVSGGADVIDEAFGDTARVGHVGQAVWAQGIAKGVGKLVDDAVGAGREQAAAGVVFDVAVQVVGDAAFGVVCWCWLRRSRCG